MESVRIQKFIAEAGICSRRAAEAAIVAGEVYVNGQKAELGQKVEPGTDKVTVRGQSRARPGSAQDRSRDAQTPRGDLQQ